MAALFSCKKAAFGKDKALFSPQGKIKEKIIESINSARHTIEIAVFIFKSGEIAEALQSAKERDINIKIILDAKQGRNPNLITDFLEDEGFNIRYLTGRIGGFMHNTFAIFDSNLIITGSYNWTEHAEKFNYENIILTDNANIVDQFQKEFILLLAKSVKRADRKSLPENILVDSNGRQIDEKLSKDESENRKSLAETSPIQKDTVTNLQKADPHAEKHQSIKRNKTQKPDNEINSLQENFLHISFNEFDDMFGDKSRMSSNEKKYLWEKEYRGRYIKWKGKVKYMGSSMYDWNKIGIIHNDTDEKANVQLKFDWKMRGKVQSLDIGYIITYTGKLESLKGRSYAYKLVDCDILKIEKHVLQQ